MTEYSQPWTGTSVGDAGPYDDDEWSDMYRDIFAAGKDNWGVFQEYLNGLEVTISATGPPDTIQVDTGGAIIDGKFYRNDAAFTEVQPTSAAGSYLVVLAKTWATQEVRIDVRIGASVTQTDGVTWEVALASFTLSAGGDISALVDLRKYLPVNRRIPVALPITTTGVIVATGNGQNFFRATGSLRGMVLKAVHQNVVTAGTTGTMDVQIRRVRDATPVNVLSTVSTLDTTETTTDSADAPAVINVANDDVEDDDMWFVDVTAIHTTPAEGLVVTLEFGYE